MKKLAARTILLLGCTLPVALVAGAGIAGADVGDSSINVSELLPPTPPMPPCTFPCTRNSDICVKGNVRLTANAETCIGIGDD